MHYPSFSYITPPRASAKVAPGMLAYFERQQWWAQVKKNGTNCVLFVAPNGDLRGMNRHGTDIKTFSLQPEAVHSLKKALPKGQWWVLNGEWLNDKAKSPKKVLYLHDVLVYRGEYLIGSEYQIRHRKLVGLFSCLDEHLDRYEVATGLWVAKNLTNKFLDIFQSLTNDADEGLVLKKPDGTLGFGKVDWALKCRKAHKNYSY